MSGVLETLFARVDALEAQVASLGAQIAALGTGTVAAAAAPANPLAALGGLGTVAATSTPTPAPTPANVTGDTILALIQPHLENDAVKSALGTEMRAMGINSLPETQPHQYAELYGRFQQVIAKAGTASAAAPASII